jgi:O-6-methylguanine DNA methyltransferase
VGLQNLRAQPDVAEKANPHRVSFRARVLAAVRRVPPGRVATYGDIAALAGSPRAWRAVGGIMRECRDPGVPCHRIIAAGGGLGGYGSTLQVKRELLRAEGLEVGMTRVRRFTDVRWPQTTKVAKAAKVTKESGNRKSRGSRGRRKAPARGPIA